MKCLPNIISILRIFLVVPTVWFLLNGQYSYALAVFLIAGLSDGLDGFLARRYGWTTRLGSFLDPLGDKLLMTAVYFVLGWLGNFPVWLVAVVIGRDVLIVLGAMAYRLLVQDISMKPLTVSKFNTVFQILLVLLMLFSLSGLPVADKIPSWLTQFMIYLVFITAIVSGAAYVFIWSRKAVNDVKKRERV